MLGPVSPPPSDLRPLAVGEIIDRAATFWRKHFKTLFLLSLGFNLVSYILTKALQLTAQRNLTMIQAAVRDGDMSVLAAEYSRFLLMLTATLGVTFWLYSLNTLAVSRYVVPTQLGEPTRPSDGMQRALKRVGTFTGAYLLSLLWAVGAILLLMLPGALLAGVGGAIVLSTQGTISGVRVLGWILLAGGPILAGLGMVGGLLWYLLRFSLLAPVMAMEDLPAVPSFRRSGALLSGRVGPGFTGRVTVRAMILVTVVSIILIAVSVLCGLPALIIQFIHGSALDPAANPAPQSLLVPAELLQVVGQAVFNPLGLVVYALLYLDMRVRREGLDLERRLEAR
ncbi:membrane protein [Archangium violaceum Cb vi76]|uniref:Membrane protein n=1 Tax=Archangium violaceum Cb vi76 TaxID=1406225 RepID=A0A084SJ41_9BACT|nr:membrane protein [Archangium violaceum Cb vi76]